MEDVVCVRIKDRQRGKAFVLTWGRIFDPVNPQELIAALKKGLINIGFEQAQEIEICESLQLGSAQKYFYEGLLSFAREPIPFGSKYRAWAQSMQKAVIAGKWIYLISPIAGKEAASGGRKRRKAPHSKTSRKAKAP